MKNKRSFQLVKWGPGLLGLMIMAISISSCDVFKSDKDVQKAIVDVNSDAVYVKDKGSVLIDLNSKVQTNQNVRLSVSSLPSNGKLTDLGKGLVQYSPDSGVSRDAIGYTVYDVKNSILKQDSIIILVEKDTASLPCGIYPQTDTILNLSGNSPISINVLANDIICGYNTSELTISIFKPEQNFAPYYGTAEVSGTSIIYTPGTNFKGNDKFIYRIQAKKDTSVTAYGLVNISGFEDCKAILADDFYSFRLDSTKQTTSAYQLNVFANDLLCDSTSKNYQYSIIQKPRYGSATINSTGISFKPIDFQPGEFKADTLRYQICKGSYCADAFVSIYLKR